MSLYLSKFKGLSSAALVMATTATWGGGALAEPVTSIEEFFQPDGMATTAENYPTHETSR